MRRYLDASLRLPAQPPPQPSDAAACSSRAEQALVDCSAYIVDERNHTTAYSHTRDGDEMQVSFFIARPPRVSFFCVSCTNANPTNFSSEPQIVATAGDLALLLLTYGNHRIKQDYYIYRAPAGAAHSQGVVPMLERIIIPEPALFHHTAPYYFHNQEVGLLRYRTNPPPDNSMDGYKIATLRTRDTERQGSRYNLYTYDSKDKAWDRKTAILKGKKYTFLLASHQSQVVITIGGDAGTMGWVDLEHGIALCDVLGGKEDSPTTRQIRYIPLPDNGPVKPCNILRGTTTRYRTVALVHGRIQYVEVQIQVRPGARPSRLHGTYFSDGWTVVRWSRTATSRWTMDCMLSASDITVPTNMAPLLPTLPAEDDSDATTLERLHIGHPTISLGDDSGDVVYFMAKIDEMEEDAWVVAVNTKKKVLQRVTEFRPRSRHSLEFTYIPTTISKYLIDSTS